MKRDAVNLRSTQPGWRGAAAVGTVGLGLGELVAAARGRSLIDGAGRALVDWSPRQMVDLTVYLLGGKDKLAIRVGVGTTVIATAIGLARMPAAARTLSVFGLSALATGLSLRRPPHSPLTTATAATVGAAAIAVGLSHTPKHDPGQAALAVFGVGSLAAARMMLAYRRRRHRLGTRTSQGSDWRPSGRTDPDDGFDRQLSVTPLITPVDQFYVTDVNMGAPLVDVDEWRLTITGLVGRPQRLSLAELAADAEEFDAVMVCIHNPVGGTRVGNGRWLGVRLQELLERADPSARSTTLVTRAIDGFTASLPLGPVRTGTWDAYVVIGLNGEPLTAEHGFPARVFVPGIYGQYSGAKWLTELELIAGPHSDYWSPRGWPHEPAWVQPQARIDAAAPETTTDRTISVAGVAWAPPHGLAGVEVRADGGSWQSAELARELAPSSWRRWRARLDLAPGTHLIAARAISRSGEVQVRRERPPFPVGASGWHTVTVRVCL